MGVIGSSGGGYATVNPTQGNPMGEALQNVENSAFRYNAQRMNNEQARQNAEQERRNARAKDIEASDKYKKDNPFIATGITDVDSQNRASLENAMNARNEAVNNYASTGDQKYKAVIAKIDSGVNEMKTFGDAYNNHVKSVTDGTANGTYNINSAKVKASGIDETHGKIVRRFDADGNSVFDVFKTDDEGVVSVVKQGLNSKQLIEYNTPVKAFHIDGLNSPPGFKGKTLVDAFNVNIDKPIPEYIGTGLNRQKRIYSKNAPEVAKTMAETSVKSKDNLYEIFTRMGIDAEDQSNYDNQEIVGKAKTYLENILLANSPDVTSPDPDTALASLEETKKQHAETNRRSDRNYNKGNKGKQTVTSSQAVNSITGKPMYNPDGSPTMVTKTAVTTDIPNNETGKTSAPAKEKETPVKKEEFAYMNKGHIKKEYKIRDIQRTNKGDIGEYDLSYFDVKTRKKIEDNQIIGSKSIANKAKAAGYTTAEYKALLVKKGIYIIQN